MNSAGYFISFVTLFTLEYFLLKHSFLTHRKHCNYMYIINVVVKPPTKG